MFLSSVVLLCHLSTLYFVHVSSIEEIHAASGDRIELECRVNSPDDIVFWLRNDVIISQGHVVFSIPTSVSIHGDDDVTFNLVFDPVTTDNEGVYQCQVPPDNSRKSLRLTVNVRPSITLFYPASPELDLHLGDELQLECRANGKPPPDIHWTKTVKQSEAGTSVETTVSAPSQLVASLKVDDVTSRDGGVYTCTADNGVGTVSRSIYVSVIYAPRVTIIGANNSSSLHVGLDDVIELVCVVESSPPALITWSHNSTDISVDRLAAISFSSRQTEEGDVSVLRIHSVNVDDVGVYSCSASNSLGANTDSLLVTGAPDGLTITSEDLGLFADQFLLQWTVRSSSDLTDVQIRIKSHESFPQANGSTDRLIQVNPPPVTSPDEYGQRYVEYILQDLEPSTLYSLVLRTSNIFGSSQWSSVFYFETAEAENVTAAASQRDDSVDDTVTTDSVDADTVTRDTVVASDTVVDTVDTELTVVIQTTQPFKGQTATPKLTIPPHRPHALKKTSSGASRDAVCRLLTVLPVLLVAYTIS